MKEAQQWNNNAKPRSKKVNYLSLAKPKVHKVSVQPFYSQTLNRHENYVYFLTKTSSI